MSESNLADIPQPTGTHSSANGSGDRSAGDRPPGGTARSNGGTKTPRKVQWAHELRGDAASHASSTHALDEHGLDPHALRTLTEALERHRETPPTHATETHPLSVVASIVSTPDPEAPHPDLSEQVPGENYIDPNERAGLPGTDLDAYSKTTAHKYVRAHKRGFFSHFAFGHHAHDDSEATTSGEAEKQRIRRRHRRSDSAPEPDVERDAQIDAASPRRRMGGMGMLSALLTLYEHPDSGPSTPSVSGSRPSSRDHSRSPSRTNSRPSSMIFPDSLSHTFSASASVMRNAFKGERPAPERNAAGVFGALVASTGNISGVAAPVPSTLAPNIKRSGFHLSRYSIDASDPMKQRQQSSSSMMTRTNTLSRSQSHPVLGGSDGLMGDTSPGLIPPPGPRSISPSSTTDTVRDAVLTASSGVSELELPLPPFKKMTESQSLPPTPGGGRRTPWTGILKDLPKPKTFTAWSGMPSPSGPGTPYSVAESDSYFMSKEKTKEERREDKERRERKRKRKKAEIFITRHVEQIIQRQEFILKFARAMMMFGGPSNRLQAQVQATGRVLEIPLSCMYLPDVILISFDDTATSTSNVNLIRQGSALDVGKLQDAYELHFNVIHDEMSVREASAALDEIMTRKPYYNFWQLVLVGGFCSSAICTVSFSGSFIDALVSFPLGAFLVAVQLFSARNELYSNVFEITIATLLSFVSAALANSRVFCYSAVASSSVVLILPGYIVLSGALELTSRNIISGSVRMCYALIYSLFLGFGLAIGAQIYEKITGQTVYGPEDYACAQSHDANGPWYQRTASTWWAFLTVPMYSLFLSMRQQAPYNRKELLFLILISCAGWATNHFVGKQFPNQTDVSSAVGAFAVGFIANLIGRLFRWNAFTIMITGILFQLPSGLGNGGLLTFANESNSGNSNSYLSGFQTGLQLISVSIGLAVGLGVSLVVVYPVPSRKRQSGIFSL